MYQVMPYGHAVVLGSGIAGLISAAVLAEYFNQVTIIEKDSKPDGPGFRPGIPQGHHFHAVIPGGLEIMEELLPGLKSELRASGSVLPKSGEFYFYQPQGKSYAQGRYMPEPPEDTNDEPPYFQTRGLLEHLVRQRVLAITNVSIRYQTKVKELLTENRQVTGVIIDGASEEVKADLVIDALGKSGRTSAWIDKMGYERPIEDIVNCDFAYTSVFMKPANPKLFTDAGFFIAAKPETGKLRGGALVRMEDGNFIVSVGGRYGDFPDRNFEGFLDYAKTLQEPVFDDLIAQSSLVGEPAHFRFPTSIRRRFESLEQFPDGLIPIGDSVCHFNPVYGQGMTSACRQALGLNKVLKESRELGDDLAGIWKRIFPVSYQETRAPWLMASIADFMHPECTGDFPTEETQTLEIYQYVIDLAFKGDQRAIETAQALGNLRAPLSILEDSEWSKRLAASRQENSQQA